MRALVLLAALAAGCTDWAALSDCAVAQSEGRRCGADAAVADAGRDAGAPDAAVAFDAGLDAGLPALDAGPPLELTVALALPGRIPKFFLETDQGLRLVTLSKGGAGGFAEVLALQSSDAGVALESFQTFASSAPAPELLDAAGGSGAFLVTSVLPNAGLRIHFDPPRGLVLESVLGKPRVGVFRALLGPAACVLGLGLANVTGRAFYPDGGNTSMVLSPCFGTPVSAVLSDERRCMMLGASSREPLDAVAVLVDTSASRALGFDAQLKLLEGLVAAMDPTAALTVAAFDQRVQPLYEGPAARFGAAQLKALRDRRPLGASDLEGALQWAKGAGKSRVLLLTDGVATAGEVGGDLLMAAVKALKGAGVTRLDAIAVGGLRDEVALRQLVTAGLPRAGALLDGALAPAVLLQKLTLQTRSKLEVSVPGASFVWPTQLDGVQPGDEVLIAAQVPVGKKVELRVGEQAFEVDGKLAQVDGTLLTRAVVQARLAALQDQVDRAADGPQAKQALREQMVALSVKHRVLCPVTALLVLETEADYARFHIDRRALADLLTVEQGALVARKRGAEQLAVAPQAQAPKDDALPKVASKPSPAKQRARADESEEGFESAPKGGPDQEKEKHESRVVHGAPPGPGAVAAAAPPPPAMEAPPAAMRSLAPLARPRPEPSGDSASGGGAALKMTNPYEGPFKQVMDKLAAKDVEGALAKARGWREEQPGDVLALVALGEALEAKGDLAQASRAYGSLIDLFPARADLRRFAGTRLERLRDAEALELAVDTFGKAAEQRGDHPASHRLLAFALLRSGEPAKAFAAMEKGLAQQYPSGRFLGVEQILREDLGLIAAAWIKAEPTQRAQVLARLKKAGGVEETQASLRFILNWETDANDVDFHIIDGKGGHAFYSQKALASGGSLYADVTTGYGPECFTIRLPKGARAYPYALSAQYYSRGPMGYGMGKLEIIEHDGQGGLGFTERPYVVMVDQAFVDMGTVTAATVK